MADQKNSRRTYRDVVAYGKPSSGSFVVAHGKPSSGSTNEETMEKMINTKSFTSFGGEGPLSFEEWAAMKRQEFQAWL